MFLLGTATVSGGSSLIYAQFGRIFEHIYRIVLLYLLLLLLLVAPKLS
jgi:hypothetical protein